MTITADYFLDKSHGKFSFSSREEPALRIAPGTGERIAFETTDAVYEELHEHHDLDQLTVGINPVTGNRLGHGGCWLNAGGSVRA